MHVWALIIIKTCTVASWFKSHGTYLLCTAEHTWNWRRPQRHQWNGKEAARLKCYGLRQAWSARGWLCCKLGHKQHATLLNNCPGWVVEVFFWARTLSLKFRKPLVWHKEVHVLRLMQVAFNEIQEFELAHAISPASNVGFALWQAQISRRHKWVAAHMQFAFWAAADCGTRHVVFYSCWS
jgi:hypothetical protein